MECQPSEAMSEFGFLASERHEMTLEQKLSLIKRCLEETAFSNNFNMACELAKQIDEKNQANSLDSLSIFSIRENSVISGSEKDNSKTTKRKASNSISENKLIGSLSLLSTDEESVKIHFRLK